MTSKQRSPSPDHFARFATAASTPCKSCVTNACLSDGTIATAFSKMHALDPLTESEIAAIRDAVRAHLRDALSVQHPRFSYITLVEPDPLRLDNVKRTAEALVFLPPDTPHRIIVHIAHGDTAHQLSVTVSCCEALCGKQPVLSPADCLLAEQIAKQDSQLNELLQSQYGLDVSRVVCDPWSVHLSEDVFSGYDALLQTQNSSSDLEHMRLVQTFLYADPDNQGAKCNHYAHPLHLLPVVDLVSQKVVSIHGKNRKQVPKMPQNRVNYHPETLCHNSYLPKKETLGLLKPLEVVQKDGPSFSIRGYQIDWFKWTLRVGFNYREGVVLHNVCFDDKQVLRRASVVEMAVPYADPHPPFPRKCAFDVGDYGLGYCANSLALGCDCLGSIAYLDATLANEQGDPYTISNAICLHEEDAGILHKHVDYRSGVAFTRRARKFVVSFIATVVNYEYLFYWNFFMDGTVSLEIRLSGELSTNMLSDREDVPVAGTLVAPGVNAQLHQHMFCARLEPAIGGNHNSISELGVAPSLGKGDDDPFGNAFKVVETALTSELNGVRDYVPGRTWRVFNKDDVNPVSGTARGYRLVPSGSVPLLCAPQSVVSKRAAFARHALWVTQLCREERFPAGEFPTQGTKEEGVSNWALADRSLVHERIVLWHSFGVLHLPRTEDFPIMPCESTGFVFKPDCFSDGNPALDVPQMRSDASVHCS